MSDQQVGTPQWNDRMFLRHPTPYSGLAGIVSALRVRRVIRYARIAPGHRVLEIGCEAGNLLRALPPCRELVGADISAEALTAAQVATGGIPNVRLVRGDATQRDFLEGERFDRIVCSETLEHTDRPRDMVRSIHRLLTDDGIAVITVPIERYKNGIKRALTRLGLMNFLFRGIEHGMSEWHVQDFRPEDIRELMDGYFRIHRRSTVMLLHDVYALTKTAPH